MSDPAKAAPGMRLGPVEEPIEAFITRLFARRLREGELEHWRARIEGDPAVLAFMTQFMNGPAARLFPTVGAHSPAGHYLSPVVNPDEAVKSYVDWANAAVRRDGPAGIDMNLAGMDAFWARQRDLIAATPWRNEPVEGLRYCYMGGPYNHGDGTMLRAMIADRRPSRIVEIGSGWSTACMLDTLDELGMDTPITCIEPYPQRLRDRLTGRDAQRVEIVEAGVERHPLETFESLRADDILFIDSTHVLKTGSDVHYELFHIIPALAPGVTVHIHDCRWPFEYDENKIFVRNFSWNEVYAVRALLMDSTRLGVAFSGAFFAEKRTKLIRETYAPFLRNPGSALWLEVLGG